MNKAKEASKANKNILPVKLILPSSKPMTYEYEGRHFDRMFHAWIGHYAGWLSPTAFMLAYFDWMAYLYISPAKCQDLRNNALKKIARFILFTSRCYTNKEYEPCIQVRKSDHRFQSELWNKLPFNLYSQLFLLNEQWWDDATSHIDSISKHHQNLINFVTRQILDVFSPSNLPWMNPEVITTSVHQGGLNFINGYNNYLEDIIRNCNGERPAGSEQYQVGVNLATTPGKVIYRNNLIELIQYTPTTSDVYTEPVLIIPACIMKYYILDLSPNNSMVKFLVDHGHTVFMISWKNPTSEDRHLSIDDYIKHGIIDALNAVKKIIPDQKIHATGYCIGGTLLMIAAAYLAKKSDDSLKTLTLFAAQADFKDAGELLLFIDQNQISYLEDIMWEKGYLDGSQMAGAFSMLHSIDLIWSRVIHDYLLGQRQSVSDLMAWDYDTTRMPYKMHTQYLRDLFLNNDFVEGRFNVLSKNINLSDIDVSIFTVSTVKDHVAPWKSVYKIHFFADTEITFILTNAGHNTGIVDEPGSLGRTYQMLTHNKGDTHLAPETWQETAPQFDGSWWPAWEKWLSNHSGDKVKPPPFGNTQKGLVVLCDAPGTYVLQK